MEGLDGTLIFWLITLGLIVGGIIKLLMRDEGLGIISNLVGGVTGALVIGCIAEAILIPGSMLLALLGTMAILFLGNVFFAGDEIHGEKSTERPA